MATLGAKGLMLTSDLMFFSQVAGAARELGATVDMAGDLAAVTAGPKLGDYRLVVLDLSLAGLDVPRAVRTLRGAGCQAPIVAFGSHVDTDRLEEALRAGCDQVLPRSRFAATLPDLIKTHLAAE